MSAIQDRIKKVHDTKQKVIDHCMCLYFHEDKYYYKVIFPCGFYPNGVRASKDIGGANALGKMLDFMEKTWIESYP